MSPVALIADTVRIDAFTILSARYVRIGRHVHIGPHCSLSGGDPIDIDEFATLSHGVRIFTASDDYSGEWMTNPTLPHGYTNPTVSPVYVGRGAIIGANSVIMPGCNIGRYAAVGALSFVKESVPQGEIWAGIPARKIGQRGTALIFRENDFMKQEIDREIANCAS